MALTTISNGDSGASVRATLDSVIGFIGSNFPFAAGSVLFIDGSGNLGQDTAAISWDDTNFLLNSGAGYQLNGVNVIRAQTSLLNYYFGPGGNLTATGTDNITIGHSAGASLTSGGSNVYAGESAGNLQTDGSNNFGLGASAQFWINHGSDNVAIGSASGSSQLGVGTTVNGDVAVGSFSLGNSANGFNACLGYKSGLAITSGFGNVVIGSMHVGNTGPTSGSQNIVIGVGNQVASQTASGQLTIGEFIYGTGLTGVSGSISTGFIGLGVKAPATELEVAGRIRPKGYTVATLPTGVTGAMVYVTDGGGALAWGATVTGGGTTQYLVWYNGSNWTVMGK